MNHLVDPRVVRSSNAFRQFAKSLRIFCDVRALARGFDHLGALERLGAQIRHAGFEFFPKFFAPTSKYISPCFDGVFVNPNFGQRANTQPAVVVHQMHRRFVPARFA